MCKTPSPVCLPSRCSRSKWSRRAAAGFSHCLQTSSCHIWSSCCARLTALSSQWPCRQAFLSGSLALDVICACAFCRAHSPWMPFVPVQLPCMVATCLSALCCWQGDCCAHRGPHCFTFALTCAVAPVGTDHTITCCRLVCYVVCTLWPVPIMSKL